MTKDTPTKGDRPLFPINHLEPHWLFQQRWCSYTGIFGCLHREEEEFKWMTTLHPRIQCRTMMTTKIGQKQWSHLACLNKQHLKCSRGKNPIVFSHSSLITKKLECLSIKLITTENSDIIWKYNKVFLLIYERLSRRGNMKGSHKNPCWAWHPSSVFHIFPHLNKWKFYIFAWQKSAPWNTTPFSHTIKSIPLFNLQLQIHTLKLFRISSNTYFITFLHLKTFSSWVYSFLDLVAWTIMKQQRKKPKTNKQKIRLLFLLLKLSRMGKSRQT